MALFKKEMKAYAKGYLVKRVSNHSAKSKKVGRVVEDSAFAIKRFSKYVSLGSLQSVSQS